MSKRLCLPGLAIAVGVVVVGFLVPGGSLAQEGPGVRISGFGDLLYSMGSDPTVEDDYGIGQAEVDLESALDPRVLASAAICFDASTEEFGLGWFTADFHIAGNSEDHFHAARGVERSGLIAGRFDVPFGIDWQHYASVSRPLVSSPLVVDGTHGAWNDLGLQGYLETARFTAAVWVTNGFDCEIAPEATGKPFPSGSVLAEAATGVRLAVRPLPWLETGASFADVPGCEEGSMGLGGGDLEAHLGPVSLRGEYIAHSIDLGVGGSLRADGWYAQAVYGRERWTLVGRLDRFDPDLEGLAVEERTSLGIGWSILENCGARFEHQFRPHAEDASYAQLFFGF